MKALTLVGFTMIFLGLGWLGFNQQRMNRQLQHLVAENQKLSAHLARPNNYPLPVVPVPHRLAPARPVVPEVPGAPDSVPRPFRPADRLMPDDRIRTRLLPAAPSVNASLSSHSPEGQLLQRSWGPEQVVGPANTMEAGDRTTAWAQYTSQGGNGEWLHVTFEKAVEIAEVIVRETYNPGAICKVVAIPASGEETIIWEGTEPPVQPPVDMSFPVTQKLEAKAVKVYLDRRRVPGWNEIDAVELVGRDGSRQWAATATVSSAYSISAGATVQALRESVIERERFVAPTEELETRELLRR